MNSSIKIIFVSLFILLSHGAFSQYIEEDDLKKEEKEWNLKDRIFFGGGFGVQFGTVTNVQLSPLVGVRITPKFMTGIGASYIFLKDTRVDYQTSIYGGSVFARHVIFRNIFAHAEFESLNFETYSISQTTSGKFRIDEGRQWVDSYYVGLGITQMLGERAAANFMILWNLNESQYSPYDNPLIRLDFTF